MDIKVHVRRYDTINNISAFKFVYRLNQLLMMYVDDDDGGNIYDEYTILLVLFLSDDVNSVAFSHDTKWVASGSYDNSARLWCIEDSSKNQILQGHTCMYIRVSSFFFISIICVSSSIVKKLPLFLCRIIFVIRN